MPVDTAITIGAADYAQITLNMRRRDGIEDTPL